MIGGYGGRRLNLYLFIINNKLGIYLLPASYLAAFQAYRWTGDEMKSFQII